MFTNTAHSRDTSQRVERVALGSVLFVGLFGVSLMIYKGLFLTDLPCFCHFNVAVCCSVLQCVAVCCSVLQCVAVCCSVLQVFFVSLF